MKWILVALSTGISGHTSITSSSWMDSPEGAYPTLEACQADISAHASASDGVGAGMSSCRFQSIPHNAARQQMN